MSKHHHSHSRRKFLGQLSMGCASLGLNTLYSGLLNLKAINAATMDDTSIYSGLKDYKALVCIVLNGGNDSFNMLVPNDSDYYAGYKNIRSSIRIPKESLLDLIDLNTGKTQFGLHPNMSFTRSMYNSGNLALVANVGALVKPIANVDDYKKSLKNKTLPLGLYSHADQSMHWQTSVPNDKYSLGWGGRMIDLLTDGKDIIKNKFALNVSLNGVNLFQQGDTIREYAIKASDTGSIKITSPGNLVYQNLKNEVISDLVQQNNNNILEKAYGNILQKSLNRSAVFADAITKFEDDNQNFSIFSGFINNENESTYKNDAFYKRLNMAAKTIASNGGLGVKRQTFYIELGGFDNHDDVLFSHGKLMKRLDTGLKMFYTTLKRLGLEDKVSIFTMSDFGRKLASNGNGSDHGWGGNAFVLGGAVNGNKIYGEYPLWRENADKIPRDAGGGRFIPSVSCDEYFAELALWFGVSPSKLKDVFPNIENFFGKDFSPSMVSEQRLGFLK